MSEENQSLVRDKAFWIEHLKNTQMFNGSDIEYCRQNNLKPLTFSGHKKRLGFTKKTKTNFKSQSFKKVSVMTSKPQSLKSSSPEWLAKFLKEFLK